MKKIFLDGIFKNNPVLVQLVGLCSVLGVTTTIVNALGMGMSVLFVVTCSNIVISLLRNFIPDKVRIPSYIVIIATFVTLVDMFLNAFAPALYSALGLFIPLIVVNCLILARAESFASKNKLIPSIVDGLGQGIGFTFAVVILAAIRELIGAGALLGFQIIPTEFSVGIAGQAPGAFILLGIIVAVFNMISKRREKALEGGN